MTAAIIAAIREVDRDQPVYDVQTMTEVVAQSLSYRWLNMTLLTIFAGVSLLLATIGIYGVIAYTASQRQREFGVRIALGAERRDIVRLVVGQGARLAAIGGIIGIGAALLVARVLEGLLYEIGTRDTLSFAGATAILLAVAIVASYVPGTARVAQRPDPGAARRMSLQGKSPTPLPLSQGEGFTFFAGQRLTITRNRLNVADCSTTRVHDAARACAAARRVVP